MSPASNLDRVAGCSPHSRRSRSTNGCMRFHPGGQHLHLDARQAQPAAFVPDGDDGVVEGELADALAVDLEVEGPPPRADLQDLVEGTGSRERRHAPAHVTRAVEAGETRSGQGLGDLEAATQSLRRGRTGPSASPRPARRAFGPAARSPPGRSASPRCRRTRRRGAWRRRQDPEPGNRRLGDQRRAGPRSPASARPVAGRGRRAATRPLCPIETSLLLTRPQT